MFGTSLWKEKYKIEWCHHCDVAILLCPKCENSTCNGSGCAECHETFVEFNKGSIAVTAYLSEAEALIYQKSKRIQRFILESLAQNQTEIDWKQMRDQGQMSQSDEELFEKELAN